MNFAVYSIATWVYAMHTTNSYKKQMNISITLNEVNSIIQDFFRIRGDKYSSFHFHNILSIVSNENGKG